jgi:hypothetical protein
MSAISLSLIAFACIFGATLLGIYLRTVLSKHHLSYTPMNNRSG